MGYSPILKPIVRSPKLKSLIDELNEIWLNEQKRREEFYNWVTPEIKAEFIDGEIIVHSPVRSVHNTVLLYINRLIHTYVDLNNLGYVGYEKVMVRLHRNDFEPDLVFFGKEKSDNFEKDQTIFPVPDFVVEVLSAATEERDRGIKLEDYEYNNVGEYWIVDADINTVDQYILTNGKYKKHSYTEDDTIESIEIKNFRCSLKAIFDKEYNLRALNQIMH
jgi:Uma2 family endonuclease